MRIQDRCAAEHERHHIGREAAGTKCIDDADGAERPKPARQRRLRESARVPSLRAELALRRQRDSGTTTPTSMYASPTQQERAERTPELDLTAVQHGTVQTPRHRCAYRENDPMHVDEYMAWATARSQPEPPYARSAARVVGRGV